MATTGMWAVKNRLDHLVNYVSNPYKTIGLETVIDYTTNGEKTIEKRYVTYLNCLFDNPKLSMVNTKRHFHDESEILAFHGYQSFEKDEVNADLAHQLGVEFAKKMWGDRFEVIVSTHLDTDNIHNHFLLNSTSFVDGKRYCNTYNDIQNMRNISDELCREHNLSVVEFKQYVGKSRKQVFHNDRLKEIVREAVDQVISVSYTDRQFYNELELEGYEIKITERNISVRHPLHRKFIRLKSLGDDYTKEKLIDRILDFNKDKYNTSPYGRLGFDIKPYCQQYEQRRLTGLQRLFLHYQYKLKILPRNNRCKLSPFEKEELQKAVQKMEEFNQQTIILCKNKIETFDDLYSHMDKIENELNHLIKERQKARNQVRKYKTKEQKDEQKLIAKSYTPEIGKLRKELMYCQKIEERSLGINKFLNEHEKQKRRKERTR